MTINDILLVCGAIFVAFWGIAHLFPTRSVVNGFGEISQDNKRIIQMEWIIEGMTLIFIGILILVVTFLGDKTSATQDLVYLSCALMLIALAIVSLFTGARIKFLPFKLCPVIFTTAAILIILGAYL